MVQERDRRRGDPEVAILRAQVNALAQDLAETQVDQATLANDIGWMKATLGDIRELTKPIPSLERRVALLEKAMFGVIALVLTAVVTAWIRGLLPHGTP